jgi:hypothetical protein
VCTGKGISTGKMGIPKLWANDLSIKFPAVPEFASTLCWECRENSGKLINKTM